MNLPKRYSLSVEVKLIELIRMPFQQQAGFDFRKSSTVTVQSFQGLAKIIEQYDELTRQIESERP